MQREEDVCSRSLGSPLALRVKNTLLVAGLFCNSPIQCSLGGSQVYTGCPTGAPPMPMPMPPSHSVQCWTLRTLKGKEERWKMLYTFALLFCYLFMYLLSPALIRLHSTHWVPVCFSHREAGVGCGAGGVTYFWMWLLPTTRSLNLPAATQDECWNTYERPPCSWCSASHPIFLPIGPYN